MKPIAHAMLYLLAGLVAGFGFAAWYSGEAPESLSLSPADEPSLQHRLERLERDLDAVVARNAQLQMRLDRLDVRLEEPAPRQAQDFESAAARGDEASSAPAVETDADDPRAANSSERRQRFGGRNRDMQSQLTAAGFSLADAQRIESRLEQLRLEAVQLRYEAMRSGDPQAGAGLAELQRGDAALRAELGESDYERFLEATGRPTSIGVTSVIESSAAQSAGIRAGDEILSYGGERIYDIRDLNRVLLEGEPGEPVLVDIVRDGQPLQVVMPRGPLGISSGYSRRGIR